MKTIAISITLLLAVFAYAGEQPAKIQLTTENKFLSNLTAVKTSPDFSLLPDAQPTPARRAPASGGKKTSSVQEPLPEKIDSETASSPVYKINSKYCQNKDGQGSEGEDILRKCKGYGNYSLWASGFDYRTNYRVESNSAKGTFFVMLFPLEDGEAAKYVRADLYDEKLADKIEWRLDKTGKPYAIIVHASFYKNIGSAKTFNNPKNKVAEFILVRGLDGYENLKVDLPTTGTAYNPDEQARMLAAKALENHR